jgi:hypothetical protein
MTTARECVNRLIQTRNATANRTICSQFSRGFGTKQECPGFLPIPYIESMGPSLPFAGNAVKH